MMKEQERTLTFLTTTFGKRLLMAVMFVAMMMIVTTWQPERRVEHTQLLTWK
jgi:hypothetical protein